MNIFKEIACYCSVRPGGGNEVEDVKPTLDSIKETSRILAQEVCCNDVLKQSHVVRNGPNAIHVRTMLKVVKELSTKHKIVFEKSVKSLTESSQNGVSKVDEGLSIVVREMFKDGQTNWGRVVAVFAFSHYLAEYCVQRNLPDMVNDIAEVTANYVENNLSVWILHQGGWESFEKQFQEEECTESKIWKGLLCTFLGLGTLATITALK